MRSAFRFTGQTLDDQGPEQCLVADSFPGRDVFRKLDIGRFDPETDMLFRLLPGSFMNPPLPYRLFENLAGVVIFVAILINSCVS